MMENNCEKCGKQLKVKIKGNEAILYCDEHGDMLVTTYFDEYERDYTKYDIILLPNNECNINNIKLIAKISNINLVDARKILMSEKEEIVFKNYTSNVNVCNAYAVKKSC